MGSRFDEPHEDSDAGTICAVSIVKRVCGAGAARRLLRDFGGTDLFITKAPAPDHPISKSIGHQNALKLAAEAFGVRCYIPIALDRAERRRAVIQLLKADGKTAPQIARAVGCSERMVYRDIMTLRERGVIITSSRNPKRAAGGKAGAATTTNQEG